MRAPQPYLATHKGRRAGQAGGACHARGKLNSWAHIGVEMAERKGLAICELGPARDQDEAVAVAEGVTEQ